MSQMVNPFTPQGMMMQIQMASTVINYVESLPSKSAYQLDYDLGFGLEKVGEFALTRRVGSFGVNAVKGVRLPKWGGNFNVGKKFKLSIMSKVQAPGMSGHRVLCFKYGKFQGVIDQHNWVLRKAGKTSINNKFWHYHWGKGKTGGHHMQLGTGNKILDGIQLRNGWLGAILILNEILWKELLKKYQNS
jgi:hypothetical protein